MSAWAISGFEELRELGAGAQGRVVLARRSATGELVAIKYLAPELLRDPRHRTMFRDEVNMLARVADPHVARLYEYVETPQGAAIVMEAVNGVSLRDVLSRTTEPLTPEAALVVLKGSLLGLAAAHAARVVHRDYKPGNVLVEGNGNSKLIDFGVAGLAGEETFAGTPAYMAPEQWNHAPASPATDVYAATCVFFECVTGAPPYGLTDTATLRRSHEAAPVPAQAVPEPLRALVAHGMAKNPAHRPPGAREFVGMLDQVATAGYGPDWERRGWIALGAATAVLAAAFPAAVLGMTSGVTGLAHGAAHLAGKAGAKGLLTKATGVKIGAGMGAAAIAATTVYLVWPAPQRVGGTASGSLHMYVTQPAKFVTFKNVTIADSPILDFTFTVSPANVRPGTTVRVTSRYVGYTPGFPDKRKISPACFDRYNARIVGDGIYYNVYAGEFAKHDDYTNAFLYPDAGTGRLPTTRPTLAALRFKPSKLQSTYDSAKCLGVDTSTDTLDFTVPKNLPHGKYQLSPIGRPRITTIMMGPKYNVPVDPESAGARAEGTLPMLTIF